MSGEKPRLDTSDDYPTPAEGTSDGRFGATSEIVLKETVTASLLDKWIAEGTTAEDRASSLANTVWGVIRWSKKLGRPMTPTLAEGFVIRHTYITHDWSMKGPGVAERQDSFNPMPEPSKSDGPSDADFYQITFVAQAMGRPILDANTISVEFRTGVRWADMRVRAKRGGYRHIDPMEVYFKANGKRIVLDPFVVTYKS